MLQAIKNPRGAGVFVAAMKRLLELVAQLVGDLPPAHAARAECQDARQVPAVARAGHLTAHQRCLDFSRTRSLDAQLEKLSLSESQSDVHVAETHVPRRW